MSLIGTYLIKPDGSSRTVWIANKLDSLQYQVGGYIETIQPRFCREFKELANVIALVDEDGIAKELQLNTLYGLLDGYEILGNVLLIGTKGDEFTTLNPDQIEKIKELIKEARTK